MAPNPGIAIDERNVQATVERHPDTGAYTLRWDRSTNDQPALILATTSAHTELAGADTIGVAALSPFTWRPEEALEKVFFTILPTGGAPIKVVDWVSPAPEGPLEGRWTKPCGTVNSDYERLGYDVIELVVNSAAYLIEARYFSNSNCSITIAGKPASTYSGQIHIGAPVFTVDGESATELNVYSSSYLHSELPRHTIFKTEGNVLRLGKEGNEVGLFDGMTKSTRPVELDSERVFVREISAD